MSTTPVVLQDSFTFQSLQQNLFTWILTDASGNPITGATVTATLYANRNQQNPTAYPGIADSIFNNLTLVESPPGTYTVVIPATFNPPQATTGWVVVVTALSGLTPIGTWSTPAIVDPPINTNDLVSLNDAKNWLGIPITNTDDDRLLQILISGFSKYVLDRTGRDSFTVISTYTEIYDGNGSFRMFLRNRPIQSVSSITIGSYSLPQSQGLTSPGWFIEQDKKSIAIRNPGWGFASVPNAIFPQSFLQGVGNIQVVYSAGHTSVPYDLYQAAMETVGVLYSRKDWKDLASKSLSASGGSGTTRYRDWHLTPGVEQVLRQYTRKSLY